jgi:hypothetical protein
MTSSDRRPERLLENKNAIIYGGGSSVGGAVEESP